MGCTCCDRKWWLGGIGIVLITIAGTIYPLIDLVTMSQYETENVLKNGSMLYDSLMVPSPPVYFEYYMWNITNPDEFEAGEKPNYVQKGPYTYVETYNKIDVVQEYGNFDNSSWIGYTQSINYVWSAEDSCAECGRNDIVVNVNIVADSIYGIVNKVLNDRNLADRTVQQWCPFTEDTETVFCQIMLKCPADLLGNKGECNENINLSDHVLEEVNTVFQQAGARIVDDQKTVDEILWGFTDPVFDMMGEKFGSNTGQLEEALWQPLAEIFTGLKYGMVMGKNSSDERASSWDKMKVRNGHGDNCLDGRSTCALRTCEILSWDDKTNLSPWYGDDKLSYCNRISGTDGMTIFPDTTNDDIIDIFVSDLCRTIWMQYGSKDTYEGPDGTSPYSIPVSIFYGPPDVFYSKSNPKNQCFCSPNLPAGWCSDMDGIQMIDQCMAGAPVVASGPHFSSASDYFRETIDGMNPVHGETFSMDEAEHTSYSAYDLTSGAIIYNSKKIQISFMVTPDDRIDMFSKLTQPLVLPIFWTNETMKLDDTNAQMIFDVSIKPMNIAMALQYSFFAIGGLLLLMSLIDFVYSSRKQSSAAVDEKSTGANQKYKTENPYEDMEVKRVSAKL